MPRAPYNAPYQRARLALLIYGGRCKCGRRATSLDHQPPLATHTHIEGSGCCRLVPACLPCQRRQGGELRSAKRAPAPSRRW